MPNLTHSTSIAPRATASATAHGPAPSSTSLERPPLYAAAFEFAPSFSKAPASAPRGSPSRGTRHCPAARPGRAHSAGARQRAPDPDHGRRAARRRLCAYPDAHACAPAADRVETHRGGSPRRSGCPIAFGRLPSQRSSAGRRYTQLTIVSGSCAPE